MLNNTREMNQKLFQNGRLLSLFFTFIRVSWEYIVFHTKCNDSIIFFYPLSCLRAYKNDITTDVENFFFWSPEAMNPFRLTENGGSNV